MAYQDDVFCETLEAIRKRLSDLRAVLDSNCCDQVDPVNINFSHKLHHHQKTHSKHSHHQKLNKISKSRHHHLHHNRNYAHRLNIKNCKEKSSNKKYLTDKIGRRLYARAIPIKKDYLLSNVEIARLTKKTKEKREFDSNKISKKPKTPILFPFEEISLKQSERFSASDYEDYSEYDYDYNDNEYYTDDNYSKEISKDQQISTNCKKKKIIYLKTYQTQEKSKKSNDDPAIFQEKGKIIYFDVQDKDSDENPIYFTNEIERKELNYIQNNEANQIKKTKNKSHKLDPNPINDNQVTQNKKLKVMKSKNVNNDIKDNENVVVHERKIENVEIIKKKVRKQSVNNEKSNRIDQNFHAKNEIRSKTKHNVQQNRIIQSKNKQSNQKSIDQSLKVKNDNKYENQNIFTFNMCIENQPICIAVGDIEGNIKKLHRICNLIKANPELNFVFIGDLIDDISDACLFSEENWKCLSLLSEFFVSENKLSFKADDDENNDIKSHGPVVSLPSAFNEIRFEKTNFDKIQSRVKFVVGNAEYDVLSDILSHCTIHKGDITKYVLGEGKWKKTVTFEQLCLLYRYFKSCYGIIELKRENPGFNSKNDGFIDTVYFKHSPSAFKDPLNIVSQVPELNESQVTKGNYILITGHVHRFVSSYSSNPKVQIVNIDTSNNNYKKKKDAQDISRDDNRLAVVSFNDNSGFAVEAFAIPGEFPIK